MNQHLNSNGAPLPHTAFYITYTGDRDWLIKEIMEGGSFPFTSLLKGSKGAVFSNETLQHFIEEELRHDHFEIVAGQNNTLTCSSSGEQRKALLDYILATAPDYIIVENLLDSLDVATRRAILATLESLSLNTLIIQLFNRKTELLSFIQHIYVVADQSVTTCTDRNSFSSQSLSDAAVFSDAIPPPLQHYELPPGPIVSMNNVGVQYNSRPILKDICWEIHRGEFWQLKGPNGSGKSTLLSLITGNNPKGYGQDLHLFGRKKGSGETVWELKKMIGYFTPLMTIQFDRMDSVENMVISGFFDSVGLYIKPTEQQVELARAWLTVIGMLDKRNQDFRMQPPAYQRMILLARAMVKHPPLLILDEPSSGLDDEMTGLFSALINKIAAETCTAILYVSHKDEPGLKPEKIYELVANEHGSTGTVR